jgi:hypothetical protein
MLDLSRDNYRRDGGVKIGQLLSCKVHQPHLLYRACGRRRQDALILFGLVVGM